jgi:hypothetical protein
MLLGLGASFGANALLFLIATATFAAVARRETFPRRRGG